MAKQIKGGWTEEEVREHMEGAARMFAELAETKQWKEHVTAELLQELVDACDECVVLFARLT